MRSAVKLPSGRGNCWHGMVPLLLSRASYSIPPTSCCLIGAASGLEILELVRVPARIWMRRVPARHVRLCALAGVFAHEEVGLSLISMFNRVSLHAPFIGSERKHAAPQSEVAGE